MAPCSLPLPLQSVPLPLAPPCLKPWAAKPRDAIWSRLPQGPEWVWEAERHSPVHTVTAHSTARHTEVRRQSRL